MQKKLIFSINIIFFLIITLQISTAQVINSNLRKVELEQRVLYTNDSLEEKKMSDLQSQKSPGVALLLSLVLPGAGHFYADRMDVGQYFLASEATLWLGLVGINQYGNYLKNDARTFAYVHASFTKEGKDDDFFLNISNFDNIYQYNNDKLARGEYNRLYDVNSFFWSWDNSSNREQYNQQRKKSERVYNGRVIFAAGLIVNRLLSAISAFVVTQTSLKNNLSLNSEFLTTPRQKLDGLRLNFSLKF
jgi:hypothetical protein